VLHLAKARPHTPELLTDLLQLRVEEPCLPGGRRWCSPILDGYPVGDTPHEGVYVGPDDLASFSSESVGTRHALS
jgi:hypothetical protein